MPTIYRQNCEYCGGYYEGQGRRFCSYRCRAMVVNPHPKGSRNFRKETRDKISKNHWSKRGFTSWIKGLTKETDERVKSISEKMKGRMPWNTGKPLSLVCKDKISKKAVIRWKDKEFRERTLKKMLKARFLKPNKMESFLETLFFKEKLPFKYTGNGEVIIGGKNPDYMNVNGQKKLIEFFGDWFHSREFAKRYNIKYQSSQDRINHFKKYGFETLIIRESELADLKSLIEKVRVFSNGV